MQIHELPTISGSPSGGYFATDNGSQTTKIDYDALAKAIIEQYSGSTLAGAAQSVKTALDGVNGRIGTKNTVPQAVDLNSLDNGVYQYKGGSENAPTSNSGGTLLCLRNNYDSQGAQLSQVNNMEGFHYRNLNSGTWGAWSKLPTRTEVDALSSNLTTFAMPMVSGSTEAEISIAYNEAHTSSPDRSWYRRLMNHGASYSVLGGGRYYLEGYRENANYGWQRATSYATAQDTLPYKCYERSLVNGTWSDWQKMPTRAEVDALNSNLAGLKIIPKTLTVGGSVTFTSETLSQYLVLVIGASGQRCAFIIRGASSTGYNVLSDTNSMTQLSVSVNGRSFTITSASTAGSDAAVIALVFSGTVS